MTEIRARLERATLQLAQRKPWQQAGEFRFAMFEGLRERPVFASFIGADGGTPALAVFLDESAVAALMLEGPPPPTLPIVTVSFPSSAGAPKPGAEWRATHAGEGTVVVRRWDAAAGPPDAADLGLVAAVIEGLSQLDLSHPFQDAVEIGGRRISVTWPLTPERAEPARDNPVASENSPVPRETTAATPAPKRRRKSGKRRRR